jgi:hypothetical protein
MPLRRGSAVPWAPQQGHEQADDDAEVDHAVGSVSSA